MTREEAEQCTILRATVGSTAHGLNLEGHDDLDEMGVCVEPLSAAMGFTEFEQFIYRSAAEREGRQDAPSQHGDLDLTIYGLKKFLRLCLHGNPTVLMLLFATDKKVSVAPAAQLQELAPQIVSRQAGKRFLGYLEAQRQRLLGERGQKKTNRPELEAKYGFDTKYAMHILRLGYQGVELMNTGKITLPMPEPERSFVKAVRTGGVPLNDVLTKAGQLEQEIKDLILDGPLRDQPDYLGVQDWMTSVYLERWKAEAVTFNIKSMGFMEDIRKG